MIRLVGTIKITLMIINIIRNTRLHIIYYLILQLIKYYYIEYGVQSYNFISRYIRRYFASRANRRLNILYTYYRC